MPSNRSSVLCLYHYDPLDRLATVTPRAQENAMRFYLNGRFTSEIQGSNWRSIIQHDEQLLAQQHQQNGVVESTLIATDQQRSVLSALNRSHKQSLVYTAYGHLMPGGGLLGLLGFNGELPDPVTGHYTLGNGYRAFNPVLMRFNSSDSLSPFGKGGLNAYAYCLGDPVNRSDPTGHTPLLLKRFLRWTGLMSKSKKVATSQVSNVASPVVVPSSNQHLTNDLMTRNRYAYDLLDPSSVTRSKRRSSIDLSDTDYSDVELESNLRTRIAIDEADATRYKDRVETLNVQLAKAESWLSSNKISDSWKMRTQMRIAARRAELINVRFNRGIAEIAIETNSSKLERVIQANKNIREKN